MQRKGSRRAYGLSQNQAKGEGHWNRNEEGTTRHSSEPDSSCRGNGLAVEWETHMAALPWPQSPACPLSLLTLPNSLENGQHLPPLLPLHPLSPSHPAASPPLPCPEMALLKVTKTLSMDKSRGLFFSPIFYTEFDTVDLLLFGILPSWLLQQDTILVHAYFLAPSHSHSVSLFLGERFPEHVFFSLCALSQVISPISYRNFNYCFSSICVKPILPAINPHFKGLWDFAVVCPG